MTISMLWDIFLGLPKSIRFCFHYFPFRVAVKLPVLLSSHVRLRCLKGHVELNAPYVRIGMIRIGFGNIGIFDDKVSRTIWENKGTVVWGGGAFIGQGSKIACGEKGRIVFGKGFHCTAESQFLCVDSLHFGEDVLISWQTLIMDTDGHYIASHGVEHKNHKPIYIGNHVWIGCHCIILKGASIADDSVVAAGTLITKPFEESACVIGGRNANIIQSDISWHS